MLKRPGHDGVGTWFASIRDWGEFPGIRIGALTRGAATPQWQFICHSESDGVGAMARFLRSNQFSEAKNLPRLKKAKPLGPWAWLVQTFRYLIESFKFSRTSLKSDGRACATPTTHVAWQVFDEATTQRISQVASSHEVSVNTWLFSALNAATRKEIENPEATLDWLMPVNMRGAVQMPRDTDNHASFIEIVTRPGDSASVIHSRVRRALSTGQHWFMWHFFQKTAAFFGPAWRIKIINLQETVNRTWFGSFSNLGEWAVENANHMDLFFCPPVIRFLPLGAGATTVNRRLSLCIQIHASVDRGRELADSLMRKWTEDLRS